MEKIWTVLTDNFVCQTTGRSGFKKLSLKLLENKRIPTGNEKEMTFKNRLCRWIRWYSSLLTLSKTFNKKSIKRWMNQILGTADNTSQSNAYVLVNIIVVRVQKRYITLHSFEWFLPAHSHENLRKSMGLQYKHRYINMHALNVFNSNQNVKSILWEVGFPATEWL